MLIKLLIITMIIILFNQNEPNSLVVNGKGAIPDMGSSAQAKSRRKKKEKERKEKEKQERFLNAIRGAKAQMNTKYSVIWLI